MTTMAVPNMTNAKPAMLPKLRPGIETPASGCAEASLCAGLR